MNLSNCSVVHQGLHQGATVMLFCEVNGRCKSVISGGNFPHTIAFATNNSMQLCNFIFIYSQLNSYFNIIKVCLVIGLPRS